jgi:hypothetical protein
MHPRIEEILTHLDTKRAELRRTLDAIPVELHATPPEPGRWSIVNVLEHLALLETRLSGLFHKRISEARAAGVRDETETTTLFSDPMLGLLTDRTRKLIAPEVVQPTSTHDSASAWQALESARERLKAIIVSADGLALGELTHSHLAFGQLTFYQWFAFVAGHEARHTAQIREIADTVQRLNG